MNNLNCILAEAETIADLICDEKLSEKMQSRKWEAVLQAKGLSNYYQRQGIDDKLVGTIMEKRMAMIQKATTIAELDLITCPKPPHYTGNGFRPTNEFAIPEEELVCWSITSLKAPLNHAGFERYMELFRQFYGALPGEPGFKGVE